MPDQTRQRLKDLIALLSIYPDGLTTPEIAEHLDVTRQTARKDLDRLSLDGIPIFQEGSCYLIDPEYHNVLRLSTAQAWFMYLPLRRIVRANLQRFQLVKSLLFRVASLLDEEMAGELITDGVTSSDTIRDQIFTDLVRCWNEHRHIEVRYRRLNADYDSRLIVAPWWFEPAVWSDAYYLICGLKKADGRHEPLTLKLDRIQSAQPLDTEFERPPGREITARLEESWGIWVGEEAPVRVVLRFHNRQHQRLQETRWHPTEEVFIDDDGSVIWRARVSEPQEMLPWIRSWGADVEVLEPDWVRAQIAAEAESTARLYGRNGDIDDATRFF